MAKIIGYSYDADLHCVDCATKRFGLSFAANVHMPGVGYYRDWLPEDAKDSEGNPVHAIFSWDDYDGPMVCCDCQEKFG